MRHFFSFQCEVTKSWYFSFNCVAQEEF